MEHGQKNLAKVELLADAKTDAEGCQGPKTSWRILDKGGRTLMRHHREYRYPLGSSDDFFPAEDLPRDAPIICSFV